MSTSPSPKSGDPSRYALRIVGIGEGEARYVRMLSPSYGGCMTHWNGQRTVWCRGDACKLPQHGKTTAWKGYTAAELYDKARGLWCPIAFEITETLELDFRGVFARGQIWLCQRGEVQDNKKPPVRGILQETVAEADLVEPFDVLACCRATYHAYDLSLNVKNPMPARVFVSANAGAAPAALTPEAAANPSEWRNDPAERARLAALAASVLGVGNRNGNGKH